MWLLIACKAYTVAKAFVGLVWVEEFNDCIVCTILSSIMTFSLVASTIFISPLSYSHIINYQYVLCIVLNPPNVFVVVHHICLLVLIFPIVSASCAAKSVSVSYVVVADTAS